MDEIKLASTNLMTIRNRCLDKVTELIKDKDGKFQDGFAICGIQDLKVQLIDCASALAEFIINGKTTESIVGKTPILLSASRALTDRKIPLSVQAFNSLLRAKKFMCENPTEEKLTDTGLEFGENRPFPVLYGNPRTKPYYYDNRFDELLTLLGVSFKKDTKEKTRKK